jgi:aryl-alcohol dehydrogenase-like predicted oxidoreductase
MAKYLMLWELDLSKTPEDAKAKKAQWLGMLDAMKKLMKEGGIKDWGISVAESNGFVIFEGTGVDLHTIMNSYSPFVRFKTRQVLTLEECVKATKATPE